MVDNVDNLSTSGEIIKQNDNYLIKEVKNFLEPSITINHFESTTKIVILNMANALKFWRFENSKGQFAFISDANIIQIDDKFEIYHYLDNDKLTFSVYPNLDSENFEPEGKLGIFCSYSKNIVEKAIGISISQINNSIFSDNPYSKFLFCEDLSECPEFELNIPMDIFEYNEHLDDIRLVFDAQCNVLQIYSEGLLVADYFNTGVPLEMGLRFFEKYVSLGKKLILKISPLKFSDKVYLERNIVRDKATIKLLYIENHFKRTI